MGSRSVELHQQLREVIRELESPLLRYTIRFTHSVEASQDIVQETFLRLCSRPPRELKSDLEAGRLPAWLYTVCRHRAIDIHRKEKRMCAVEQEQLEQLQSPSASPTSQLEQKQTLHSILEIIRTLPENQQEVVFLKFQSGLSYKQISEVTDLSVSHVGVLLHKAMKLIRRKVEQSDVVSPVMKGGVR